MVSETFVSETAQHTHKVVYTIRILKFIGAKYERELWWCLLSSHIAEKKITSDMQQYNYQYYRKKKSKATTESKNMDQEMDSEST